MSRDASPSKADQSLRGAAADLEIDPSRPIESLQNGLAKNAAMLIELFKSWDADNDGTISRKEFYKGVKFLGLGEFTMRHDIIGNMDFWNPMFVLSEGFARAHGLHDRRPKTQAEAVDNVEIDMSKIAQMTTDALGEVIGREVVENALLDIVDRIGDACSDAAVGVVTLDFKFGKLLCENKSLEFIFGSPGTASQAAKQPNAKPPGTASSTRGGGAPPPSRGSDGGRSVKSDATSLDLTGSAIARRSRIPVAQQISPPAPHCSMSASKGCVPT